MIFFAFFHPEFFIYSRYNVISITMVAYGIVKADIGPETARNVVLFDKTNMYAIYKKEIDM